MAENLGTTTPRANENQAEVFKKLASKYWEKKSLLWHMNSVRVPFIVKSLVPDFNESPENNPPLKGINILDIGSGVGLLSEPLAERGANVTGVDPEPENTKNAQLHSATNTLIYKPINYVCGLSDHLLPKQKGHFDAVVASEVIEHVDDPKQFVKTAVELTRNDGSLFFTTINRTWSSYLIAIFAYERVFRIITRGIHDWNMFVKPEELESWLKSNDCEVVKVQGFKFNPFTKKCTLSNGTNVWYIMHAVKKTPK